LASLKQRAESLDLALEPGTSNLEIISLGLDNIEFGLKSAHLVHPFLTVATGSHGVGLPLFDSGHLWGEWAGF
jgi:hypothetical protein